MNEMNKQGKLLIFSAPSGSGKTTLVKYIMKELDNLSFSISATSRPPRGKEEDGKDYYFMSANDFRKRINSNDFVEWEEVYDGRYYGTLKAEVERIRNKGQNVVFDVDVIGGLNIKKLYGDAALAIFVKPPSIDILKQRLKKRDTDSDEEIRVRIEKAEYELSYANDFDIVIINDDLEKAKGKALWEVSQFINK